MYNIFKKATGLTNNNIHDFDEYTAKEYESLYADIFFSSNNSIILNLIASGNNTTFPTFPSKV